jgi:putative zinc finger/helix-turn-helix YgiT family protein
MKKMRRDRHVDGSDESMVCAECGSGRMERHLEIEKFLYGTGDRQIELEAEVTAWTCPVCGFEVSGADAEDKRHEAVCKHLGVLCPAQIRAIRRRRGLSQAEFARFARVGEASVKRWESGALVQNASTDLLLRLLDDDDCARRVLGLAQSNNTESAAFVFQTPISKEQRRRAGNFLLVVPEAEQCTL